jgi:spore maturation protein CgeB
MMEKTQRSTGIRVLFTGEYWPGSNTIYIARSFQNAGAIVRFFDETRIFPEWTSTTGKVTRRFLKNVIGENEWNRQFINLVETFKPDLVYISQAQFCWHSTLEKIKKLSIPIICFYHDVQWNLPGRRFAETICDYDLIVTTRTWHESEFIAAGAKAVEIIRFGYEPLVHRPVELDERAFAYYGADITFIATNEPYRAAELEKLLSDNFPYNFKLWGGLWNSLPSGSKIRKYWQKRDVDEEEIPVIYAASKIALHWLGWEPDSTDAALRKGDQHNSRTFQIAACGGAMMLAQKSDEHLRLFESNKEAIFFSDLNELRDLLKYWLNQANQNERQSIAKAARQRCIKEDYSYNPIVIRLLKHFNFPYVQV